MKGNTTRLILITLLIASVFSDNRPLPWSSVFTQVSEKNEFGKSMGSLI